MTEFDLGIEGIEEAVIIGSGGFATVYKARQPTFHRTVAIKVLNVRNLDERAVRRFERECQAMGTLSTHPSIATVYDAGFTNQGRPFLMMAYQSGGSLEDRIAATGPYRWQEASRIGIRLSGALETAHRAGVIHRDIKPSNVLMSDFGEPQLSDFGIARISGGVETQSGVITASVAHAAPEVMDGNRPTEASDVYSLASTVFALIAGKPAFVRETDESIVPLVLRVHTEPVPDLRSTGVPDSVCAVLEHAMSKAPEDRPQTAEEFGRNLQDAQASAGVGVTEMLLAGDVAEQTITISAGSVFSTTPGDDDSPSTAAAVGGPALAGYATVPVITTEDEVEKKPRPPWFWVAAAFVGTVVVVGGIVGVTTLLSGDDPVATTLVPQSTVATVAPTTPTSAPPPPTTQPPLVAMPDVSDVPNPVAALEAQGLVVTIVEEHSDDIRRGTFLGQDPPPGTDLPPGSEVTVTLAGGPAQPILFQSDRDGGLSIYRMAADGTMVTAVRADEVLSFSPDWSPDNTRIVFIMVEEDTGRDIFIMDADGSNLVPVVQSPGTDKQPVWSPVGDRIAFASDREEEGSFHIYAIGVDGNNEKQLTNQGGNGRPSWSPDGTKIAFQSNRANGNVDIWIMNANGSGQTRLTNHPSNEFQPAWSPDGTKIVFVWDRDGDQELYLMELDAEAEPTRLTTSPGFDYLPVFTPDGTKVIFTSRRNGDDNPELYVIDLATLEETRLTDSAGRDEGGVWSPFG